MKPTCKKCGKKVWRVSSGLVCDECTAKIVPVRHYESQACLPLDWSGIETIKGRGRVKYKGTQPETLFEQNERLSMYGERQPALFTA